MAMTLESIEDEAVKLAGEDSPEACKLYRLGRRVFFTRLQQITELAFPGQGFEIGINLLWEQTCNTLPGGAVTNAIIDSEEGDTMRQNRLKKLGLEVD